MEEIIELINSIAGKYNSLLIFDDWVTMMAISISNSSEVFKNELYNKREQQYLNIVQKYNKEEIKKLSKMFSKLVDLFTQEIDDYLGKIYMKCEMR